MAREPSYPEDTPVGSAARDAAGDEPSHAVEKGGDSGRTKHLVTGAAIGIGSAAIVAALLYANRNRKG